MLPKVSNLLKRSLFQVGHWSLSAMWFVMMVMVLLTVVDVILRRFFNSPLAWSFEFMQLGLVIVVWSAVLYSTSKERHISIDVLVARFPAKARRLFRVAFDLVSALVLLLIGWQSIIYAMVQEARHQVTVMLGIPTFPFVSIVALGAILAGLMLLVKFIDSARGEVEP